MKARITPSILKWAIERSRKSEEAVAEDIKTGVDRVLAWLRGDDLPTMRQAEKLAGALCIPFGYLYLSSPPDETPQLPDLRTLPDASLRQFSPDFIDLLNDARRKLDWYREFLREEGNEPLSFVGSFKTEDDEDRVAADIARRLGINDELRAKADSWEDFLRRFVCKVEEAGILVLRSGIVGNNTHRPLSVEEFRGFVLTDEYAPLIFINGKDSKAAQIFTLAHELAHVWIGSSGVINIDMGASPSNDGKEDERFCSAVAAEVLVPRGELFKIWRPSRPTMGNIDAVVRHFRVSSLVALRRSSDLDLIDAARYQRLYDGEKKRWAKPRSSNGGDFHATALSRNSAPFVHAVVAAAFGERLLFRDAARLLGVKVGTLDTLAGRIRTGVLAA